MISRVDMHCHSTASQLSRLGVQRSLGLPECATPPQEVYELAKRRGMDFVTIADHDTIDGCLELADRPDCFVSEELTARFAGEAQAVHVLCYGIDPGDHEWLQAHAGDVAACPGGLRVLYAGRLTREKGVDLLATSFLKARRIEPRLHLMLAGGGSEEGELRSRLGEHATFLGWLEGEELARAYASADLFLFCSTTDTYGQVVVEAGASGLPVVAVSEGGPASLIENRHTGILCRPDADRLAGALLQLASSPALRRRLGAAARRAAEARSWDRALAQLAAGYRRGLGEVVATPQAPARAA